MCSPSQASGGGALWHVYKGHSQPIQSVLDARLQFLMKFQRDVEGAYDEQLAGVLMDIFNLSLGQAVGQNALSHLHHATA